MVNIPLFNMIYRISIIRLVQDFAGPSTAPFFDPAFKAASVPSSSPMRRKVLCATKADSATRRTPLTGRNDQPWMEDVHSLGYSWTYPRNPKAYNWNIHPNWTYSNWDMAEISQWMVGLVLINGLLFKYGLNHISQLDIHPNWTYPTNMG